MICSRIPSEKLPRPSKERVLSPRKSRIRGSAIETRRSRNSHLRALAGDRGQLVERVLEHFRLGLRVADAHVQRDLLQARHVHQRADAELLFQLRPELLLVALLQARLVAVGVGAFTRACHYLSISSPQSARLQTRTCSCLSLTVFSFIPIRVGRLQVGQTTITLATGTGAAFSITPPGVICVPPIRLESRIGFGRVWRLTVFRFSTITRRSAGRESRTRPCLPRSLPLIMWTRSPFLTFILGLMPISTPHERSDVTNQQVENAEHFSLTKPPELGKRSS